MLKSESICRLFVVAIVAFVSSGSFAALTDTFEPDVPNYIQTVTLDKYDGTDSLVDIKLTLFLSIDDGQFEFDNDNSDNATVVVDLEVLAAMASTDVVLPGAASVTAIYGNTVNLTANDGDSNRGFNAGGTDYASFNTGVVSISTVLYVSPADFAGYLGTGTFDIDVAVSEILNITSDSGVAIRTIPELAEGAVSVEYIVPEPLTMVLFGFGGLMISRRRAVRSR